MNVSLREWIAPFIPRDTKWRCRIKKRLSDEGWTEELVFMGSKELARLRDLAVKRPVKLTDRGT